MDRLTPLFTLLTVCLGEFLIACLICGIMNRIANRKEEYMNLLFAGRTHAPGEHKTLIEVKYCFTPNGKYMAREYKGMNMHERHRLKRGTTALAEMIGDGRR